MNAVAAGIGKVVFWCTLFIVVLNLLTISWPLERDSTVARQRSSGNVYPATTIQLLTTHHCGEHLIRHLLKRYARRHDLVPSITPQQQFAKSSSLPFSSLSETKEFSVEVSQDGQWVGNSIDEGKKHGRGYFGIQPKEEVGGKKYKIAIVRDPYVQFTHMWLIEDLQKFYKRPLNRFIQMDKYQVYENRKNSTFGLSQTAFDFGVDGTAPDYELFFLAHGLADEMDLILVVERLEESLVLMKETLQWSLEDVAMVYLNHTLLYYRDGPIPSTLIEAGVIKLSEMNNADMKFYRHFDRALTKRIKKFGEEKMKVEVEKLRALSDEYERKCIENNDSKDSIDKDICSLAKPPEFEIIA